MDDTAFAVFRAGAEWTTLLQPLSFIQLVLRLQEAAIVSFFFFIVFDAQEFHPSCCTLKFKIKVVMTQS